MTRENFEKWFVAAKGYNLGPGKIWFDHPMWKNEPRLTAFPKTVENHRLPGWPGPPSQRASEVQAKYIVTDMFAKAVQGESPEAAAAWAEQELKHVYNRA
jgi:multiple sugar transport system substrate-binding protein